MTGKWDLPLDWQVPARHDPDEDKAGQLSLERGLVLGLVVLALAFGARELWTDLLTIRSAVATALHAALLR